MVWDRVGVVRVRGPGLEGRERRQGIPKLPNERWGEAPGSPAFPVPAWPFGPRRRRRRDSKPNSCRPGRPGIGGRGGRRRSSGVPGPVRGGGRRGATAWGSFCRRLLSRGALRALGLGGVLPWDRCCSPPVPLPGAAGGGPVFVPPRLPGPGGTRSAHTLVSSFRELIPSSPLFFLPLGPLGFTACKHNFNVCNYAFCVVLWVLHFFHSYAYTQPGAAAEEQTGLSGLVLEWLFFFFL